MDASNLDDEVAQRSAAADALAARLRERARRMDVRGRVVLFALVAAVAVGLAYYVAAPIYLNLQNQLAQVHEERRTLLLAAGEELTPRLVALREDAARRTRSVWVPVASGTTADLLRSIRLPEGRLIAVGGEPGVQRSVVAISDDNGHRWRSELVRDDGGRAIPSRLTGVAAHENGRIVIAVGTQGHVLRSADAGMTWQAVVAGGPSHGSFSNVVVHDTLVAAVSTMGTLALSQDTGQTWQAFRYRVSSGKVVSRRLDLSSVDFWINPPGTEDIELKRARFIEVDGAPVAVAFGSLGTVVAARPTDAGFVPIEAHRDARIGGGAAQYLDVLDVAVLRGAETILAVGGGGNASIQRSRDQGLSWRPVSEDTTVLNDLAHNDESGLVVAVGDNGTIKISHDLGDTWGVLRGRVNDRLRDVRVLDGGQSIVAVGNRGIVLRSDDGGENFAVVEAGVRADLRDLRVLPGGEVIVVGESGTIARTTGLLSERIAAAGDATALRTALEALPPHARAATEFEELRAIEEASKRIEADLALAEMRLAEAKGGRLTRRERTEELSGFLIACAGPGAAPEATAACVDGYRIAVGEAGDMGLWRDLAEKVPGAVLLLFLLATLGALYRYNLRMAGFYDARADALELAGASGDREALAALADVFAAERVEFAKAKAPSEQALSLAEKAVEKIRPG